MYRALLLLHLAGVISIFVGVGGWFFAALTLRGAQRVEDVRSLALIYEMGVVVALVGILVVAASGLYMALAYWSLRVGWIQVAIGAFALMAPVGPLVVAPRIERLILAVRGADESLLSPALRARVQDPVPKVGQLVVMGDLAGIVSIMTIKPSFLGSILVIVAFTGLGALLSLPVVGSVVLGGVEALARLEQSRNPLYRP